MRFAYCSAILGLAIAPAAADAQPIPRGFERGPVVRGGFGHCGPRVIRRRPRLCPNHRFGYCNSRFCDVCRRRPIRDCWYPRRPFFPRRAPILNRGFDRGGQCDRFGNCDIRRPIFRGDRGRTLVPPVRRFPRGDTRDFRRDVDIRPGGRGPSLVPPVPPRP